MGNSQLCVAVTGRTMSEILRNRDAAAGADIVEMRLDTVDRPDVAGALRGRQCPVIVTCRAAWEKGFFQGSEEERRRILEEAVAGGAEYVDVEAKAEFAAGLIAARGGRGVVVSSHVYGECPADLADRWQALIRSGAEIAKLAVEVQSLDDTAKVMALGQPGDDGGPGRVLIAMGDQGLASRVLSTRIGNRWTYAGDNVAPGQVSAQRMIDEFRFYDLRPGTAVYGVVGNPVMHSLSPAMHNAGFRHFGIDAVYLPLLARDAADFVAFARSLGLAGASITAPFKVHLMEAADELEPLAQRVGAINTLTMRESRWLGANTDVYGFAAPLIARLQDLRPEAGRDLPAKAGRDLPAKAGSYGELSENAELGEHAELNEISWLPALAGRPAAGLRASILAAGGAARAVAVALADLGAAVTVCARRLEAALEVAALANGNVGELPPPAGSWDVLVNTTTWDGDAATYSPIAPAALAGRLVYDLLYVPAVTKLMADASAAGCTTIGGLEMLVAQAEKQFQTWTGQTPPAGLFQRAAEQSQS
jgi:3-dehydroquinate dehydratase/shikimate dehydrogenase